MKTRPSNFCCICGHYVLANSGVSVSPS